MYTTHPFESSIDREPRGLPIPNDTSSERSRLDVCDADVFGIGMIPDVEISSMIEHGNIGPGVCDVHRPILQL